MTFVLLYTVVLAMKGLAVTADRNQDECGVRPAMSRRSSRLPNHHRHRQGRIIDGSATQEGQFPWQVSLELLHPSMGFIGHWCGGVLIDQYWVLSAAHCIHNDLFNLPLPPLWTVLLGEYNRHIESGYEQRISVDKIVMHSDYEDFQHDLVLIKLSEPAKMGSDSTVRKICLPFIAFSYPQSVVDDAVDTDLGNWSLPVRDDNFLRSIRIGTNRSMSQSANRRSSDSWPTDRTGRSQRSRKGAPNKRATRISKLRRRNDKFLHEQSLDAGKSAASSGPRRADVHQDLPYVDCIATGWGKSSIDGDLTDILLQTAVPIHDNAKCKAAYGSNVRIHRGHLCAGSLNGKGGTCVGDSGGPLQCRISKNGPWMLAGVTSFGSGCAEQGYPDVYSRISHYVKWITDTIAEDQHNVYSGLF